MEGVHVLTPKTLKSVAEVHKAAAKELMAWLDIVESARWRNFLEVRHLFLDADAVDGYVIFNIRGTRYRLITKIHYAKDEPKKTEGRVFIRSLLTHAEYDDKSKWDPSRTDA
jgi:mRNA interferase HigB